MAAAAQPSRAASRAIQQAQLIAAVPTSLEVAPKNIDIPPPRVYPPNMGPFLRAAFLVTVYANAVEWSETKGKAKKKDRRTIEFGAKALLRSEPEKADAIFAALENVRDEQESRLSPVMWAWWRISSLMSMEGWEGGPPSILTVFKPDAILSPKLRAMFWKDGMSQVTETRVLWPLSAGKITALWQDFQQCVLDSPDIDCEGVIALWDTCYKDTFLATKRDCARQAFIIKDAIDKAVTRSDIGVWLAENVVKHLKLSNAATTELART